MLVPVYEPVTNMGLCFTPPLTRYNLTTLSYAAISPILSLFYCAFKEVGICWHLIIGWSDECDDDCGWWLVQEHVELRLPPRFWRTRVVASQSSIHRSSKFWPDGTAACYVGLSVWYNLRHVRRLVTLVFFLVFVSLSFIYSHSLNCRLLSLEGFIASIL